MFNIQIELIRSGQPRPYADSILEYKVIVSGDLPNNIDRIIEAIRENDLQKMCYYMGNNLELVTQRQHPMIGQIKEEMMAEGALQSMMSGSGPTVFGIFNTVQEAETAGEVFRHRRGIGQVYVSSFYHVKGR